MKFVQHLLSLAAFMAMLSFVACKKDTTAVTDALKYVPVNAAAVTAVDMESLMRKVDFDELKKMEFYQAMLSETSENNKVLSAALENPLTSGIDFSQKLYISTEVDKDNPELNTTYIFVPLKDADAFGHLFDGTDAAFTEESGVKMMKNAGNNTVLGWKGDVAVAVFSNARDADLNSKFLNVFSPPTENPMLVKNEIRKALDQPHDIATWLSTNALVENSAAKMGVKMLDLDESALQDNFIYGYSDFEKGAIKGHTDFHFNKALGEDFIGRFFKKEVSTDFSRILPSDNLSFAAVGAVDFRGIDQFLSERPQTKGFADFTLNDLGFKREDLIALLGGDILVAGIGADNSPSFLVALSLKDENKAREFLAAAAEQKKLKEIEKDFYKVTSIGNQDFSITVNKGMGKLLHKGDLLIYSTDDGLLDGIRTGKAMSGGQETKAITQFFDDQTVAGWFNLGTWQKIFPQTTNGHFKEMRFNINGKGADFILETTDANANSLQAIFQMVNEAYLNNKLGKQEAM